MTATSLVVAVRFHHGRYHGRDDGFDGVHGWPPSPGRLFQALVAAASRGGKLLAEDELALKWLERLAPPRIAAPAVRRGQTIRRFVPNNDLDAKGGDPDKVAEIRVGKPWRACYFDHEEPILYVWDLESGSTEAARICTLAHQLYQLGRGLDMAYADGRVMSAEDANTLLRAHPAVVRKPGGSGETPTPYNGTLDSLLERHREWRARLAPSKEGSRRQARQLFRQPRKASFRHVGYDAPARRLHFELRGSNGRFASIPLTAALPLLIGLRDGAAGRLRDALPDRSELFDRLLVGRDAGPHDIGQRIRIVPVPSIGMARTDPSIRRVLVEIPQDSPVRVDDLKWAFAGLEPHDPQTGEVWAGRLVSTGDSQMADHYLRSARLYRTITPATLPRTEERRRRRTAWKSAAERTDEEERACSAVVQSLRHAGVSVRATDIRVQKEPFRRSGARAEMFDVSGSRFAKNMLWHVELRLQGPIAGPLLIGNGRFCGLGLMEPIMARPEVVAFNLAHPVPTRDAPMLVRHLRRALMSLGRDNDAGGVDKLFSGHEPDGRAGGGGRHEHVFLACDGVEDGAVDRMIVVAPWAADRRAGRRGGRLFDEVTRRLTELKAGHLGRFHRLVAEPVEEGDRLIGPALVWTSITPYVATRNLKKRDGPAEAVKSDVAAECDRRGLPVPQAIDISDLHVGPRGGGAAAKVKLRFAAAVRGPLLLGKTSHKGGGVFHAVDHGDP